MTIEVVAAFVLGYVVGKVAAAWDTAGIAVKRANERARQKIERGEVKR